MIMVELTLAPKQWLKYLSSLGENVTDVILHVNETDISFKIADMTHYLSYKETLITPVTTTGQLVISDLMKTNAFIKKCKNDVTIKQGRGNRLSLQCGSMKMTLPCWDNKSAQRVPTFDRLVKLSKENQWQTFGRSSLDVHGTVDFNEIVKISSLGKLISPDSNFQIKANADENEFVLSAFKRNGASIFASATLENAEGPNHTAVSNFGAWLLPCICMIDTNIPAQIHFGDSSVLIIQQTTETTEKTVVIIDHEE